MNLRMKWEVIFNQFSVHEIALKRNLQVYFEVVREAGPPHMRTFITKCIVGDFLTEGEGNGKKVSKKRAAELMLDRLKQLPPVASAQMMKPRKVVTGKKKSRNLIKAEPKEGIPGAVGLSGSVSGLDTCQTINPISRLIQIQQAKKEKEPVYTLIAERGMPRRREFVMQVWNSFSLQFVFHLKLLLGIRGPSVYHRDRAQQKTCKESGCRISSSTSRIFQVIIGNIHQKHE